MAMIDHPKYGPPHVRPDHAHSSEWTDLDHDGITRLAGRSRVSLASVLLAAGVVVLARQDEESRVSYECLASTGGSRPTWTGQEIDLSEFDSFDDLVTHENSWLGAHAPHLQRPEDSSLVVRKDESLQYFFDIKNGRSRLKMSWSSTETTCWSRDLFIKALIDILDMICRTPELRLQSLRQPTPHELQEMWTWNSTVPPTIRECMHGLIMKQSEVTPDAPAIHSWDGSFCYREVQQLSDMLAHDLLEHGMGPGQVVPMCFEKSRWTTIAVLAVMKTGAGFALVDPSQPTQRLAVIAAEIDARFVLCSRVNASLAADIAPETHRFIVDAAYFDSIATDQHARRPLPAVNPSSTLYIVFTSGSTGKPKGVVISHEAYTSGAIARAEEVGYDTTSRVLDFASYAFDVSVDSILCTLLKGGCLCIPSDAQRVNDLNGAIRDFGVTMANLTPSVARILEEQTISQLRSLGLGGEAVSAKEVNEWGKSTRIMIAYGPSECTVGCTIARSAASGKSYTNLGRGIGGLMWIVDPDDPNRLRPLGAVGELIVEGPIVGTGYLKDPIKTSAAFIDSPDWLAAGYAPYPGRQSRLYKTGDLCRYDQDGSGCVVFVGRKDTQVKIRGQRVELGEIEHAIRQTTGPSLRCAVEVLSAAGGRQAALMAFITKVASQNKSETPEDHAEASLIEAPPEEMQNAIERLRTELPRILPSYMVPTTFVPLNKLPILVSGKTDRKILRKLGENLLESKSSNHTGQPDQDQRSITSAERTLWSIFQVALDLPHQEYRPHASFYDIGGTSVTAMKVVGTAKAKGIALSVTDILTSPRLQDVAAQSRPMNTAGEYDSIKPFDLISPASDVEATIEKAAAACNLNQGSIQDILPCTPLQETLIAFSQRYSNSFVARRIIEIPTSIGIDDFKSAWETVVSQSEILRTRIVQLAGDRLYQVITNEPIDWKRCSSLREAREQNAASSMTLGAPLAHQAIIGDGKNDKAAFLWTVHHALYDAWSLPLVLERLNSAVKGKIVSRQATMRDFVHYLSDETSVRSSASWWKFQLDGFDGLQFPVTPDRDYIPNSKGTLKRLVTIKISDQSIASLPNLIRAGWALIASQHTASQDVVFGETLAGRDISLKGATDVEGPLVTTVPVRIEIDRSWTAEQFLQHVRDIATQRIPHQHYGLQNIRRLSSSAQLACELKTGINIQLGHEDTFAAGASQSDARDTLAWHDSVTAAEEAIQFNSYALLLVCSLVKDGFVVNASFDTNLCSQGQMERMLAQLQVVCSQLSQQSGQRLQEMNYVSGLDLDYIWSENASTDSGLDGMGEMPKQRDTSLELGQPYPVNTRSWILDLQHQSRLAPVGVAGELAYEVPMSSSGQISDPSWLLAGHGGIPGRRAGLLLTGDVVQYGQDGRIIFKGDKETFNAAKEKRFDLVTIENQLKNSLPSDCSVDANVRLVKLLSAEQTEACLVACFSEPARSGHSVKLDLPKSYDEDLITTFDIASEVSPSLAKAILSSRKAMQGSSAPSMVPKLFLPVKQLSPKRQISFKATQTALIESQDFVLQQLKQIAGEVPSASLSPEEESLRALWSELLCESEDDLSPQSNFFRAGGDSIIAMKLASMAREAGMRLSVADVLRNPRLDRMAFTVRMQEASCRDNVPKHEAFSLLDVADVKEYVAQMIEPRLKTGSKDVEDIFPPTEMQQHDMCHTIGEHKSSLQYFIIQPDEQLDVKRLKESLESMTQRHEILRSVWVEVDGQLVQVVLRKLELPLVKMQDTSDDVAALSIRTCETDSATSIALGTPLFKVFEIYGANGKFSFVVRLSHAQYDGMSFGLFMQQLRSLYEHDTLPSDSPTLGTYMSGLRRLRSQSIRHWTLALSGSALTYLDGSQDGSSNTKSCLEEMAVKLPQCPSGTTLSVVIASAWAILLNQRTSQRDITFGAVRSGRAIEVEGVEEIMGSCYQILPVRVQFKDQWTAKDVLRAVQDFQAAGSSFETLGFHEIARECTDWSSEAKGFDSIVNHQEVPYHDHLQFGDSICRFDTYSPAQESAHPWKIVSYQKEGEHFLGMMGPQAKRSYMKCTLSALAGIIAGTMAEPSRPLSEFADQC